MYGPAGRAPWAMPSERTSLGAACALAALLHERARPHDEPFRALHHAHPSPVLERRRRTLEHRALFRRTEEIADICQLARVHDHALALAHYGVAPAPAGIAFERRGFLRRRSTGTVAGGDRTHRSVDRSSIRRSAARRTG